MSREVGQMVTCRPPAKTRKDDCLPIPDVLKVEHDTDMIYFGGCFGPLASTRESPLLRHTPQSESRTYCHFANHPTFKGREVDCGLT